MTQAPPVLSQHAGLGAMIDQGLSTGLVYQGFVGDHEHVYSYMGTLPASKSGGCSQEEECSTLLSE